MQVGIEQCSVVVLTVGRPSLDVLLDALAQAPGPRPAELVLVDDRPTGDPLRPERPGLPPLRVVGTGARLVRGRRWITHPVRPVDRWVSVRVQAGNADDVLMRRLHGPDWRGRPGAPPPRRPPDPASLRGRTSPPPPGRGRGSPRGPPPARCSRRWPPGTSCAAWSSTGGC